MNVNGYTKSIPQFETNWSDSRTAVAFATLLIVGLVLVVPLIGWMGPALGVPQLLVLLGGLALVGTVYGLTILLFRKFVLGSFVALLVLSTFAANIPLASDDYLTLMPGSLGPQLWLVQVPLFVLLGYFVLKERTILLDFAPVEYLYAGFVGWTFVSALFASGPRPDVALYFTLLMLQGLLVFVLGNRIARLRVVDLRTTLAVLAVTVTGHALFGIVQLLNQNPVGLTYLGEGIDWNQVTYEPFGFTTRVIVSGFTGHGYVLIALILLVLPALLLSAARFRSWSRLLVLADFVLLVVLVRLSTSDAGRGAGLLVLLALTSGFTLVWLAHSTESRILSTFSSSYYASVRQFADNLAASVVAILLSLVVLLYPSSKAGTASTEGTTPGGDAPAANGSDPTGGSTPVPNGSAVPTDGLSVPFFDLSNFGIRIQQYLVGLDLFLTHPLVGIGGANFAFVATDYGIRTKPNSTISHALHNIYFALLAETGLPGFLLYVATVCLTLYIGWTVVRANNADSPFALALLVGMGGVFAFGFWTHAPIDRITTVLPLWILGGVLVGVSRRRE